MADVTLSIQLGFKNAQWFTDNATRILKSGQIVYRSTDGKYKIGDGITQLSSLTFYGGIGGGGSTDWSQITNTPTTLGGYGITDAIDGSGASNRVPYFSDSNTLTSESLFEFNGTNMTLGIAVASAGAKMHIKGSGTGTNKVLMVESAGVADAFYVQENGAIFVKKDIYLDASTSSSIYGRGSGTYGSIRFSNQIDIFCGTTGAITIDGYLYFQNSKGIAFNDGFTGLTFSTTSQYNLTRQIIAPQSITFTGNTAARSNQLVSLNDLIFRIDADNDESGKYFAWQHNDSTELMRLNDSGQLYNESGDFVAKTASKGLVLKDTQGTPHYWRVTIDNTGTLVTTDLGTTLP